MRAKKDPRLADLSSKHSNAAADMPVSEPAKTKQAATPKAEKPVLPGRKRVRLTQQPWFLPTLAIGCAAVLAAVIYSAGRNVVQTMDKNRKNELYADIWSQLLASEVAVNGTPSELNEQGFPTFPSLSYHAVRRSPELYRTLRLASALPGVESISLAPESMRFIGRGVADDTAIQIIADGFDSLDSLNLNGSSITTVKPLEGVRVRALHIVNTSIKPDNLSTLKWLDSVTDLWAGWYGSTDEADEIYMSDSYRKKFLEAVVQMKNLQRLHVQEMVISREEREMLGGINLIRIN